MTSKKDLNIIPSYWFPLVFANCKAIAGAMFCRLWAYADDNGQCYMTIPKMQQELGEGYRPIVSAKTRLEACGLINTCIEKYAGGLRTKVRINLDHPFLHKEDQSQKYISTKSIEEDTSETGVLSKCTYPQNASMGTSETQVGVLAKRKDGYLQNASQYTDISTDINTELNTELCAKTFEAENYDPDLAFFERQQELGISVNSQTVSDSAQNAPERKDASLIGNVSTLPAIAASDKNSGVLGGVAAKPDEPKKKKERKPRIQQTIPQTAEEVKPYIEKFLKRHENEDGYKKLDVTYYAGSILDFYLKDDGTWRDNKNNLIHEPYRKVSSWLSHDLQEGKLKQAQPEDERLTDEERDEFLAELSKALDEKDGTTNTAAPIEATFEFVEETELLEHKHD